jgi:WD40 repeat protein
MYQYVITFTAVGATGTTPVSATTTVTLTDPPIVMDTNPVTPATLPAGNGNVTQTFNGANCGFTSTNGLTSTDAWSGTRDGEGTPDSATKNGISTDFVDCNHVTMGISYSGFIAGDQVWDYLYNPPPGGGISPKIITNVVATTNSSAVSVSADGTTASLKSQSVVNYLDAEGNIAKTVTSAPGEIHFGSNVIPAGDIHQLITCSANFCGLGKNQLTVFTSSGIATKRYTIPEDARFAVANNDGGIYVFATDNGHLYNLDANDKVTLVDGFASAHDVTAAALSHDGNELAALSSNGQLQRLDVSTGASIGTYTVPADMNNLAYSRDGSILLGKLGSAEVTVLDRSGAVHEFALTAPLKTIVQADQADPLISMETGDVIRMDSFGDSTLMATAPKPEDLNAGFRIAGRTLVLTHVDPTTNARQVQTLATQQ